MDGEGLIHVPNPAAAKVSTRPGVEQEARQGREELTALTPLALRSFAAWGKASDSGLGVFRQDSQDLQDCGEAESERR